MLSINCGYAMTRGWRGSTSVAFEKQEQPDTPLDPDRTKTAPPPPDSAVGDALRAAYQSTVNEAIPVEMLDLLSKLK